MRLAFPALIRPSLLCLAVDRLDRLFLDASNPWTAEEIADGIGLAKSNPESPRGALEINKNMKEQVVHANAYQFNSTEAKAAHQHYCTVDKSLTTSLSFHHLGKKIT
jgi:hypothetical protein